MPQYTPEPLRIEDEKLRKMGDYLHRELQRLSAVLDGVQGVILPKRNRPPAKLVEGMVVLADGTNWNPGSGAGFYGYNAGAWHFLG